MSAGGLDPIAFALDVLEVRGAAVERGARRALVLLPANVAASLALPETCALALEPEEEGDFACGLGTPLLEKLLALERAAVPRAAMGLALAPPRGSHARSLGERFAPRNAVADVQEVRDTERAYAVLHAGWAATADDRHEGLVTVAACVLDGSDPPRAWVAALDADGGQGSLFCAQGDDVFSAQGAAPWLAARAERAALTASESLRELARRRAARDHARIAEYYSTVATDAASRSRRVDPAALESKLAHVAADRNAKLAELAERYAMRVSVTPVALVVVLAPVVEIVVRVRRRKAERFVTLRMAAGATGLDALACDGCAGPALRPAFCDDRVHTLCDSCVPSVEGRPRCPACAAAR